MRWFLPCVSIRFMSVNNKEMRKNFNPKVTGHFFTITNLITFVAALVLSLNWRSLQLSRKKNCRVEEKILCIPNNRKLEYRILKWICSVLEICMIYTMFSCFATLRDKLKFITYYVIQKICWDTMRIDEDTSIIKVHSILTV